MSKFRHKPMIILSRFSKRPTLHLQNGKRFHSLLVPSSSLLIPVFPKHTLHSVVLHWSRFNHLQTETWTSSKVLGHWSSQAHHSYIHSHISDIQQARSHLVQKTLWVLNLISSMHHPHHDSVRPIDPLLNNFLLLHPSSSSSYSTRPSSHSLQILSYSK